LWGFRKSLGVGMNVYHLLDSIKSVRVLCIGDIILDRYVYGEVNRISPEAPIPILTVKHRESALGGVGNVVANLSSLDVSSHLVAVTGEDEPAFILHQALGEHQGTARLSINLIADIERPTSVKVRHIAGIHQMLRVDAESTIPLSPSIQNDVLTMVREAMPQCDVVVLSDYGKGVLYDITCQAIITLAQQYHKPVVVDPKGHDYTKYTGASYITPNRQELSLATGISLHDEASLMTACHRLIEQCHLKGVLATRSEDGMSLALNDSTIWHIPTSAQRVYDVTGAGDTVVAVFAAGLAVSQNPLLAARLSNVAAGLVVAKRGAAQVTPDEVIIALDTMRQRKFRGSKIYTQTTLEERLIDWRRRGFKIGFTNGCFDILHVGHLSLLEQAKLACDRLVVGLNTDESVKKLKGEMRPLNHEKARATLLSGLECVDGVILFDEETPFNLIRHIMPDVLIKGSDYTLDTVVGADIVQQSGGTVLLVGVEDGYSTTGLVKKIKSIFPKS
jgi:D-beta-D-heptose 7-phosphate kinase / D-beta-D-heptose 1-phosphate adenosyltransferase